MASGTYGGDDLVYSVTLYNLRPLHLHGYIAPFVVFYAIWFFNWLSYGISVYFEAGMVAFAAIGIIQILTFLSCHWSVHARCLLTCNQEKDPTKATVAKVIPTPNNGSPELVYLHKIKESNGGMCIWFLFQKMKYLYDFEECGFEGLDFPDNMEFKYYQTWKGYANERDLKIAEGTYGKNDLEMVVPKFMDLFQERATAPFFVFQVFCVALWCLDEFWYYSLFTLAMLITFECTLVQQQLRNMSDIRRMGNKPYKVLVYRNMSWKSVMSNDLIPGDIVSICRSEEDSLVPCDLLLLRGPCIADESMLTGETVPQTKEPVENLSPTTVLDMQNHKQLHVLFGGTKILQHSPPEGSGLKASDNGCVAYVLRNSFCTSQGKLLRTILFGVKRVTANNLETFCFILFLLVFAIAASSYVWIKGTEDPTRNRYKLFLECTLILTSVVPPELPIELSLAVNTSLLELSNHLVYCTEPFRIPFAGKVEICCFDKTGTLTKDSLVVEGIAGLKDQSSLIPMNDIPPRSIQVLATCHNLAQLGGNVVGDPLEKATLEALAWNLTRNDSVNPKEGRIPPLKIHRRFHFSSSLKRMSTICSYKIPGSAETVYVATIKGAPEVLKPMFEKLPDYYDNLYMDLSKKGSRVLALGRKELGISTQQAVDSIEQEAVECKLEFCGFIVFSCSLKPDSKEVIREIIASSHRVVMITGDAPLTACFVAKELNFTRFTNTLILTPSENEWKWRAIHQNVNLDVQSDIEPVVLYSHYDLCITGDGLEFLKEEHKEFLKLLLPHIRVFARFSPKQKEYVINELKALGHVTLMCGDGTNDVGALKHADVGIAILSEDPDRILPKSFEERGQLDNGISKLEALAERGRIARRPDLRNRRSNNFTNSNKRVRRLITDMEREDTQVVKLGDASIAAPFTGKISSIRCVCQIIKQGRCTLVTTLQMYKILALNALILAYSQSVLYLDGIKFSDTQATLQGLLLAGCFLFISRSKPLNTLSAERPLPNIFNPYTIMSVILQFLVHFASLVYLVNEATSISPTTKGKFVDLEAEFKPSVLNSSVYIISVALQLCTFVVNYRGYPFMQSLTENKPLLYSICITAGAIVLLVTGIIPPLSYLFSIVYFNLQYQGILLCVLIADFLSAFALDRICQFFLGKREFEVL